MTIESHTNEPTIPSSYRMKHPNIPLGINDLNLPIKFFRVMTPISLVHIKEEKSQPPTIDDFPIQEELFNVAYYFFMRIYLSAPSMSVSSVNAWETSSDIGTFYADEPR